MAGDASVSALAMPVDDSPKCRMHREKIVVNSIPDNLCVACPVGKADIERTLAANVAMNKEWDRLRSKDVWDEAYPRDWDEARAEAQKSGVTVQMGYMFGMCVQRNSELEENLRKLKGRVVCPR